jgi:hypothetical protein
LDVKEKKGEKDRGKPLMTRSLHGRQWRGSEILCVAVNTQRRWMRGSGEGKGCGRDSTATFKGQGGGEGAIAGPIGH